MSIPVDVKDLATAVADQGPVAYLLTSGDDGRPHATHVTVVVEGSVVSCGVGRRTARNGAERPLVSMVWPPTEPGGYSLIVDGELTVEGSPDTELRGHIAATNAVLHRPAPGNPAVPVDGAACAADCVEVGVGEAG